MNVSTILGYVGTALILLAYLLVSRGILDGKSKNFQLINLCGSLALLTYSLALHAVATVILNAVWLAIAAITLLGRQLKKDGKQKT